MKFTIADIKNPKIYKENSDLSKIRYYQEKLDGIRIVIIKTDNDVKALTKYGKNNYIDNLPNNIADTLRIELPPNSVLDCELFIRGVPSSDIITHIKNHDEKLKLRVFGVPYWANKQSYTTSLFDVALWVDNYLNLQFVPTWHFHFHNYDPPEKKVEKLVDQAASYGIEGYVLKEYNYSGSWYKIKPVKTIDCFIIDRKPGEGKFANTLGSLELGVLDQNGNVVNVGSVGTGFSNNDRDIFWNTLFIDQITVEVEYDSMTRDNKLRFPRFKQIREDKAPRECSVIQVYAKH